MLLKQLMLTTKIPKLVEIRYVFYSEMYEDIFNIEYNFMQKRLVGFS